jgi:predicted nucleic acid-binding protein
MAGVIVLDASVLIGYLDAHDAHHRSAEALLAQEIDDDFGASSVTLAEIFVAPVRENRLEGVRAAFARFGCAGPFPPSRRCDTSCAASRFDWPDDA